MMFQKKVDRAFKWLEEKNKDKESNNEDFKEEDVTLEKKDYLAMFISSIIVFFPLLIILLVIALWAFL